MGYDKEMKMIPATWPEQLEDAKSKLGKWYVRILSDTWKIRSSVLDMLSLRWLLDIQVEIVVRQLDIQICSSGRRSGLEKEISAIGK